MAVFLTFSHQLFNEASRLPVGTELFLIEDARCFRPQADAATAVFQRAAFQAFREKLLVKGYTVHYLDAETYPSLSDALEAVFARNPKTVSLYATGDTHLDRQVQSACTKHDTEVTFLESPAPHVKVRTSRAYVPQVLPPVEPDRYVQEAFGYYSRLVPTAQPIEFAVPVTPGDARDWLETVPELLYAGASAQDIASDLMPLIAAGLIDQASLERTLDEAIDAGRLSPTTAQALTDQIERA